jgi:hypothetical protein
MNILVTIFVKKEFDEIFPQIDLMREVAPILKHFDFLLIPLVQVKVDAD